MVLGSGAAFAEGKDASLKPSTEGTAYTLRAGDFKLGVFELGYGLTERLQLETCHFLWLLSTPNLNIKYRLWEGDDLSLAGSLGLFRLDLSRFQEEPSDSELLFSVVPVSVMVSYQWSETLSLSAETVYTRVELSGKTSEESELDLEGAAAQSNLQVAMLLDWRWAESWSLFVQGRYQVFQVIDVKAKSNVQVDDYTTLELYADGQGEVLEYNVLWSLVPGLRYVGETFHAKFGLGFGNLNLPYINFVIPEKTLVPSFDLYWVI